MIRPPHSENHFVHRIGWLRAAILGANDGIVSTASLVVGVAAADPPRETTSCWQAWRAFSLAPWRWPLGNMCRSARSRTRRPQNWPASAENWTRIRNSNLTSLRRFRKPQQREAIL